MANQTCLVVGAGGYLGSELSSYLRAQGWEVRGTYRQASQAGDVSFTLGGELPSDAFDGVDAIVLCAYDMKARSWTEISETNIQGSKRVLEAARSAGIKTVLTISSISAYPGCKSLYGKAKLEIESATLAIGGIVVRPGLIYGGSNQAMHGKLLSQATSGKPIPLLSGSPCAQFLVNVEDLCRIIEGLLSGRIPNPTVPVTIAHPKPWPLKDLLKEMAGGRKLVLIPVPWWFVWSGIRCAEALGLRLGFKSDGVISVVYQDMNPGLSLPQKWGESVRGYGKG